MPDYREAMSNEAELKRLNATLQNLSRQNHVRGHGLTVVRSASTKPAAAKCELCSGNAIARAICMFCLTPLCRRHTRTVDGNTYCPKHAPGYVE